MLKIITLVCALTGLLIAVSVESWLRRHHGNKDLASSVYQVTLEKYGEFWLSEFPPLLLVIVLIGLFLAFGLKAGYGSMAAYAAGALTTSVSVMLGSRSFSSAAVSSSSTAAEGDIKGSFKAAYRGGVVIGLTVSSLAILVLGLSAFYFQTDKITEYAGYFGMGAAASGLVIRISGAVLTNAHKLADTDESNVDYTGVFAANGADFSELSVLALCSAFLLAEAGVQDSGIMGTFGVAEAMRFPIVIMACGIAASAFGMLIFRPSSGKYNQYGFSAGNYASGVLVFLSALYFSKNDLDYSAYSYCIGFGIAAQLLSGDFCTLYSMDSRVFSRNLPKIKDEDIDIPMLHALSAGLVSSLVPGILTTAAILLSYSIAKYYGVALAAIGATSISAINLAVRNYAGVLSASSSFAEKADLNSEENSGFYAIIKRTSSKAKSASRTYSSVASSLTLVAVVMAVSGSSQRGVINLNQPVVFGGMIGGTVITIVIFGLLLRSILKSTGAMTDLSAGDPDEYRNIYSVRGLALLEAVTILSPLAVGYFLGIECTMGFLSAAVATGMALVFAFNNTGRYYDRSAADAITTVLLMMSVVILVCADFFTEFGGIYF